MKTRMIRLASLLILAAGMGGCISSAPQEVVFDDGTYEVRSHSMVLNNSIRLTRRNVEFNQNGFLQAQIEAVNLRRKDTQYQYRFRWLDERKMVVPAATAIWKTQSLGAKSTDFFTATAPTTECRDFYLEVRFVHDSTRW